MLAVGSIHSRHIASIALDLLNGCKVFVDVLNVAHLSSMLLSQREHVSSIFSSQVYGE